MTPHVRRNRLSHFGLALLTSVILWHCNSSWSPAGRASQESCDIPADEIAVLEEILDDRYRLRVDDLAKELGSHAEPLLELEFATQKFTVSQTFEEMQADVPQLQRATYDSFVLRAAESKTWPKDIESRFLVRLVDSNNELYRKCVRRQAISLKRRLREHVSMSRAGVNADGSQALLFISSSGGPRDFLASVYFLEKRDGKWTMRAFGPHWIS